jgi:hypothetical protein
MSRPLSSPALRPLSAEAGRLLSALAKPEAYGVESEPPGRLLVAGKRNGVSVRTASVARAAAAPLVSEALACWEPAGRSGKRRLMATEAGRKHVARAEAAPGVDPFRAQHGHVSPGEPDRLKPPVERAESPLAWLAIRKGRDGRPLVEPVAFEAGERLRRDLTLAQMLPRISANWSSEPRGSAGATLTYSDAVIAARQRVRRALDAAGPDFAGILIDVCGFLKGLEMVEGERGWPARSAKVVLGLALAALARHYGTQVATTGAASRGLRHWGTEDFRPTIEDPASPASL